MEVTSDETNVESLVSVSKFDSLCGGSVTLFIEEESSLKLSFSLLAGRHPELSASLLSDSATDDEEASSTGSCSTCVGGRVTSSEAIRLFLLEEIEACGCPATLLPGTSLGATFTRARRDAISVDTLFKCSPAQTKCGNTDAI